MSGSSKYLVAFIDIFLVPYKSYINTITQIDKYWLHFFIARIKDIK